MDLDERAGKFETVKWNTAHTSFRTTCPGSNGVAHELAVSASKAFCLGHPRCDESLITAFFANGADSAVGTEIRESDPASLPSPTPPATSKTDADQPPIQSTRKQLATRATTLDEWKTRLWHLLDLCREDDPDYFKDDQTAIVLKFAHNIDIVPYLKPPAELSRTDAEEEIDKIVALYIGQKFPKPTNQLPQLPDIFAGDLQIMSGRQLLERHAASKNQTVIDGMLALKEISIWSGKVEAGKTTLLRTAAMCVARGEPFLERTTVKGRVLYVMLDADGIDLTTQEFLRLGYDPDRDPIDWLIDPILAMRQDGFSKFYGALLRLQPTLVIIDPFGRFQEIKDFNAYDATYAMARISELAKQANCHIALPHHIPRGRNDDADAGTAGLGSISIGGGTNARFVCTHKPGDIYTIKTSKGKGASFVPLGEEYTLNRHPDTGWITLGQPYSWKAQAVALKSQVLEVIERSEEPLSANQIGKELGLFKSACGVAANMLWEDGEIEREGTGKRGKKYLYSAKKRVPQGGSQYDFNS